MAKLDENCDISVVLPVHNEEDNLEQIYFELSEVLDATQKSYEFVFVDDGSFDGSFSILRDLHQRDKKHVRIVRFSRNYGHQLAITAGIQHARGKAAIIMDADRQEPPELLARFIEKWDKGYDIVFGIRKTRKGETIFKKLSAKLFYKIMKSVTNVDMPQNVGDFYLLDRKILDILNSMQERHRYMRGLVAWVGFKKTGIYYDRKARVAGKTKFSFFKMFKFSWDALTSFSFVPLRLVAVVGAIISFIAFCTLLWVLYIKIFTNASIVGWSSIMAVVLFIGGIQLLSIGVIGEYVARIGDDVKSRPLYTVSQVLE